MTEQTADHKPKRKASRYSRKQFRPVEDGHSRHRPPVAWCRKCRV